MDLKNTYTQKQQQKKEKTINIPQNTQGSNDKRSLSNCTCSQKPEYVDANMYGKPRVPKLLHRWWIFPMK